MRERGQATVFIIIALALVFGIVIYFAVRGSYSVASVPPELSPVFNYYEECIRSETSAAIEIAGSQGGYIDTPPYAPGSDYAPFSSELNFLGLAVPYWYYVSGNGLIKEQVPSINEIESEIAKYVEIGLRECNFESYYIQGFNISVGEPNVRVDIQEENVNVIVNSALNVNKGDDNGRRTMHEIDVESKFGKFYGLAKKIYEFEKAGGIFDNYAVDVLRLYAPVDGVELGCSGKIWKTREVINELKSGLEANMAAIKLKGDYYKILNKEKEYFVADIGENIDENVNFIYTRNMPSKIEINGEGVDDELLIASPVGLQEGLGVMGFCYSPYHFIYDVSFPLLIQVYNNEEVFQFPIAIIIDNNIARNAVLGEMQGEQDSFELCENSNNDVQVNLYDMKFNHVEGDVSYQCFNQKCRIGKTKNGELFGKVPSCLNGQLVVRAEGFAEKKVLFSSNKESLADIFLERVYETEIELKVGGKPLEGSAIITFAGKDKTTSASLSSDLRENSKVSLSDGEYDISVYVYGNSGITIPASTKSQCQDVPSSGILGMFGRTKKQCFNIEIPETKIDYALKGGGKSKVYILEDQLIDGKLTIEVAEFNTPSTLEELQYNYVNFETQEVYAA